MLTSRLLFRSSARIILLLDIDPLSDNVKRRDEQPTLVNARMKCVSIALMFLMMHLVGHDVMGQ